MGKLLFILILSLGIVSSVSALSLDGIKKQVFAAEKKYGLPSGMLDSIITIESNYSVQALNPENYAKDVFVSSYGLGQLTYATAQAHCGLSKENILNPVKNILCSAKVLKYQMNRFGNSILYAVAAYNLGTPCVCDGKKYIREMNGVVKVCQKFNTKKVLTCSKKEINRFLNQPYVENFITTYKRLHPESSLYMSI